MFADDLDSYDRQFALDRFKGAFAKHRKRTETKEEREAKFIKRKQSSDSRHARQSEQEIRNK